MTEIHHHQGHFPSMLAALDAAAGWETETRAAGLELRDLFVLIDARDPERVHARLAPRAVFREHAPREFPEMRQALDQEDPRGELRAFIFDTSTHGTDALSRFVASVRGLHAEDTNHGR